VVLRHVVDEVWAMLVHEAGARTIVLHDELGDGAVVLADRKRLKQVLSNLLSNAIKYNRDGGWVRVALTAGGGDKAGFTIADGGSGLTPDQQARLFSPFDRLGAERSGVQGTGLGLALTKQLLDAMGGSISVSSAPGVGSTFTVRLPTA
jgi:signal transduction histidine kinase